MVRNRLRVLLVMAAALLSCGCQLWRCEPAPKPPTPVLGPLNHFVSPYWKQLAPRRVVIVAPQSRQRSFEDQQIFATALATQLRAYGVVESVFAGPATACDVNAIRQGQFNEFQLVQLAQAYNADAVIFCDVISMSAYTPLETTIALTMVDARESVVLMATDGTWQLGDPAVAKAYHAYLGRTKSRNHFSHGVYQQSPTTFLTFVAGEISQFMAAKQ